MSSHLRLTGTTEFGKLQNQVLAHKIAVNSSRNVLPDISPTDCCGESTILQLALLQLHNSHSKKDIDLWSQRWWKMVLDTHPPKCPWSHWVWMMVPTHIQISILIHGFIDRSTTVDIDGRERIRSISTVDHSLRIAVDRGSRIKYRDNLRSILSTTHVINSVWR